MVLLTGEFLQEAKPFVEDGVHSQLIIFAFYTTLNMCENIDGVGGY
jgi:chaperonin GroEL (HSP60 family)